MQRLERLLARFTKHAHGIDHRVDAVQPRAPGAGVVVAGEVDRQRLEVGPALPGSGRVAHREPYAVAGGAQAVDQRSADQPGGAGQQQVHRRRAGLALLRRASVSGAIASLSSAAVLMLACRLAGEAASDGPNATSQWLWGRAAWWHRGVDLRHTVLGYAIHHASSVFWALGFEALLSHRRRPQPAASALGIGALAAFVDYRVVPPRLTPGFEAHLRRPAIAAVYLAFAGGLYAAVRLRRSARGHCRGSAVHRG